MMGIDCDEGRGRERQRERERERWFVAFVGEIPYLRTYEVLKGVVITC